MFPHILCGNAPLLTKFKVLLYKVLSQFIPFFTPCIIEEGHLYATDDMEGKNS